jgi:beta-phosphoglucomutase family hydrolase
MSKLGALLFDLDGTIVDNMDSHLQAWVKYLGTLGVKDSDVNIYKSVAGKTTQEVIRTYFGNDLTQDQILEHYKQKEALYKKLYYPVLREIPGVIELLDQAQKLGIPMAIASAAGIDNIDFILDNLKIRKYFSAVVSAGDVKNGKPDPEIFLLAAKRLGMNPSVCLVFEDSIFGLEGAYRAGMKAIAITTAHSAAELKQNPAVIKVIDNYLGFGLESILEDVIV